MVGDSKYASTIIILLKIHIPTHNWKWKGGVKGVGPWDECHFSQQFRVYIYMWEIIYRLFYLNRSDAVWFPISRLQIIGHD